MARRQPSGRLTIYGGVAVAWLVCLVSLTLDCAYGAVAQQGVVREYFISADKLWDYAPSGRDVFMNQPFTFPQRQRRGEGAKRALARQPSERDTLQTNTTTPDTTAATQSSSLASTTTTTTTTTTETTTTTTTTTTTATTTTTTATTTTTVLPSEAASKGAEHLDTRAAHNGTQASSDHTTTQMATSAESAADTTATVSPESKRKPTTTSPMTQQASPTAAGHHQHGPIGHHHGPAMWMQQSTTRIGRKYYKARYRAYTDATFQHLKPVAPEWRHLGLLGPVIRAAVGDTIKVVYRNNVDFPTSIHPHGLHYTKENEGAPYADNTTAGDVIAPGETYAYTWQVPEQSGPGPQDGSSVAWVYHSHVDEPKETNAGLLGVILVTARDKARDDATPSDVDRELVAGFFTVDEGLSSYFPLNVNTFLDGFSEDGITALTNDEHFQESNRMYSINGRVYGNMPGFRARVGERVRWYIFSFGNQQDLHTPHWHGNTLLHRGHRVDVMQLLPAYITVADMRPTNPGLWMFQCHVTHHIHGGMYGAYRVEPGPNPAIASGRSGGALENGHGDSRMHSNHRHLEPSYSQEMVQVDSSRTATLTTLAIVMAALLIVALAVLYRRRHAGRTVQYKPLDTI